LVANGVAQHEVGAALQATATSAAPTTEPATPGDAVDGAVEEAAMPAPTVTAMPDNFCIECHSDEIRLQDLADEPVETVSLNEGSG
jgi:cytochrome c5